MYPAGASLTGALDFVRSLPFSSVTSQSFFMKTFKGLIKLSQP